MQYVCFFFFNDTATTEIYTSVHTLSLHDALPISLPTASWPGTPGPPSASGPRSEEHTSELQSRTLISYAVFCLKKKKLTKTVDKLIKWMLNKNKVENHVKY